MSEKKESQTELNESKAKRPFTFWDDQWNEYNYQRHAESD